MPPSRATTAASQTQEIGAGNKAAVCGFMCLMEHPPQPQLQPGYRGMDAACQQRTPAHLQSFSQITECLKERILPYSHLPELTQVHLYPDEQHLITPQMIKKRMRAEWN